MASGTESKTTRREGGEGGAEKEGKESAISSFVALFKDDDTHTTVRKLSTLPILSRLPWDIAYLVHNLVFCFLFHLKRERQLLISIGFVVGLVGQRDEMIVDS